MPPTASVCCQVAVADSVGELVDSSLVTFTTNATEYEKDPIQSNVTDNWNGGCHVAAPVPLQCVDLVHVCF